MCCFPLEIQQFWHINKINELVNAAKIEYFLGNMKDCENQSTTTKIRHSQNAYNYWRFWRKNGWWRAKTKIRHSKNAYNYCRFWTILMITMVEERWRTFKMWILARTCDKNEPPVDPNNDDVLSKVDFFGSHSDILKSAESIMCTALQFYLRTQNSRREAKPTTPKQLREW